MVEGGGLENRFTSNRDGGSNPSPSAILFIALRFENSMKSGRIGETYSGRWRGAGVVEQGRLLSDCADKNRYRGFESHPLRHTFNGFH